MTDAATGVVAIGNVAELAPALTGVRIDVEPRRVERASDHAPIVAEFR